MSELSELYDQLVALSLSYPEAWEDFPWDERVTKVRKKIFVFFGHADDVELGMSVKLPESGEHLLHEPWATPTGYGLGKAGWVSLAFRDGDDVDPGLLEELIDESYRAVAPKTLVKQLDAEGVG